MTSANPAVRGEGIGAILFDPWGRYQRRAWSPPLQESVRGGGASTVGQEPAGPSPDPGFVTRIGETHQINK
jgi:hypothetical protein